MTTRKNNENANASLQPVDRNKVRLLENNANVHSSVDKKQSVRQNLMKRGIQWVSCDDADGSCVRLATGGVTWYELLCCAGDVHSIERARMFVCVLCTCRCVSSSTHCARLPFFLMFFGFLFCWTGLIIKLDLVQIIKHTMSTNGLSARIRGSLFQTIAKVPIKIIDSGHLTLSRWNLQCNCQHKVNTNLSQKSFNK